MKLRCHNRVRHALGVKREVFMHRTNKPRPQGAVSVSEL